MRSSQPASLPCSRFQARPKPPLEAPRLRCARWAGRMSCDSMMLNTRASITTLPITPKKLLMGPSTITIGMNAAMVVSTPKMTGMETSRVPSMAALTGDLPTCSWL